jgi:hypothetical protein
MVVMGGKYCTRHLQSAEIVEFYFYYYYKGFSRPVFNIPETRGNKQITQALCREMWEVGGLGSYSVSRG